MSVSFFLKTKEEEKALFAHSNFSLDTVFNLMLVRFHPLGGQSFRKIKT